MRPKQKSNPNRAALRPQPQPKNRARQRLINYQINQSQQKRREAAAEAIFLNTKCQYNSVKIKKPRK